MSAFINLKTERLAQGWSITDLARHSNTSDRTVLVLEDGGTCGVEAWQRILDALAAHPVPAPPAATVEPPKKAKIDEPSHH